MDYNPDGPIKVLVVSSDSPDYIRTQITDVLTRDEKIVVVGVMDKGADAIRLIGKLQPHVILVNDTLADMDGIQFIGDASKRYPVPKCLIVSECEEPQFRRKGMLAGAVNFIKNQLMRKICFN
jgi:chemotaxis response regulator CheB